MRILHTSDWHLGRSFHREGMLEHQRRFLHHLVEVVEREAVDLVIVAGDVYDRALPPVDAVQLADSAFGDLAASRARVVVTSGNHDSALRLGFGSRLMDAAGVHVRTDPHQVGSPIELEDEHGPVLVYALPYLDPETLREPWGLSHRSHEAVLTAAMERVRDDLAGRPAGSRSVVVAHAFVAGCQPSDSERDISVGGISVVPTSVFDGIDYVALGHLHGAQVLAPHVRYSGSPLAYSFSEAGHTKGSWLVDLGPDGVARDSAGPRLGPDTGTTAGAGGSVTFVPAPVPRPLVRLRGRLETLLTDPALETHTGSWAQVTLTDPVRPVGAMEALRRRFPHALVLAFDPEGGAASDDPPRPSLAGRSDHAIALDFVAEVRGAPATPEESDLLQDACEQSRDDAASHAREQTLLAGGA